MSPSLPDSLIEAEYGIIQWNGIFFVDLNFSKNDYSVSDKNSIHFIKQNLRPDFL